MNKIEIKNQWLFCIISRIRVVSVLLVLTTLLINSCTVNRLQRASIPYELGSSTINITRINSGQGGYVFFNMHENENTSIKAGKKFLRHHAGIIYYLEHSGDRNIAFRLNEQEYTFDPNRIYTDEGIRLTLSRFGDYDDAGHQAVRDFANYLLDVIKVDDLPIVLALHNNGPEGYSSSSYLPGGPYENDAAAVFQETGVDADDFFFVTDSLIYTQLASARQNVVLQNNTAATDDGSLSVYCGQRLIPYVNLEAQHRHKKEQYIMFQTLNKLLEKQIFADRN